MLDVEVLNSFLAKTKRTRKDIADKIGMSETCFSQKANGKRAFTVSEALRLAEATKMPQKTFKEIWKDENNVLSICNCNDCVKHSSSND